MPDRATWPSAHPDWQDDWEKAVRANCDCVPDPETGMVAHPCASHREMYTNQRWINGLVWARELWDRLTGKDAHELGKRNIDFAVGKKDE